MKILRTIALLLCAWAASSCQKSSAGAPPKVESATLKNGVKVTYQHVPGSEDVSIFTFLPMGLAGDEAGRGGWAHLVEHLVIRTTAAANRQDINAETMADHMRLDFYGTADNWREGLSHHARWLAGLPFTEQSLQAEKQSANAEADNVVPRLFAHKFAISAWAQAARHVRADASVKAQVNAAALTDIQQYRDQHLFVPAQTLICGIGGVAPAEFMKAVEESVGKLTSEAKPQAAVIPPAGDRDATWDLDARHVILTWPIPAPSNVQDHAALMLAGRCLMMRLWQDAELSKLAGPVQAGADLAEPEGWYFYVSAAARPGASTQAVKAALAARVARLGESKDFGLPAAAWDLAKQLLPQDPKAVAPQMPANATMGMAEAQACLFWGTQEFRYGPQREALADQLPKATAQDIRRVAGKWLGAKQCRTFSVHPPPK